MIFRVFKKTAVTIALAIVQKKRFLFLKAQQVLNVWPHFSFYEKRLANIRLARTTALNPHQNIRGDAPLNPQCRQNVAGSISIVLLFQNYEKGRGSCPP